MAHQEKHQNKKKILWEPIGMGLLQSTKVKINPRNLRVSAETEINATFCHSHHSLFILFSFLYFDTVTLESKTY